MIRIGGVLLACTLVLGACGDDDDGDDDATDMTAPSAVTTEAPAAASGTVTIKDFKFSALSTKAGAKVIVKNDDSTTHTYTSDDDAFDAGRIDAGKTGEFTAPTTAGSYKVHCEIHSSMSGTLTVT